MKALTLFLACLPFCALAQISTFFNQNEKMQYTEPYRKILRRGDNLEHVLLDEIAKAKKTIFIAVLEFRLPLVAQALIDKKNQGVDVRIVLDNDYNFNVLKQTDNTTDNQHDASRTNELHAFIDMNKNGKFELNELMTRDAMFMLQKANIPILDDSSDNSSGSGLMHHKFLIVDGRTTVVSSGNFTMSCFHGDVLAPGSRGNANSMIVVQSQAFANIFSEEFSQLWGNGKHGNYGQGKTYRGPRSVSVNGTALTVQFSPTSKQLSWDKSTNGLIGAQINKASNSVKAALFVYSDQKLGDLVKARSEAGVNTGFLVENTFAFRDYSELMDMLGLKMLNPQKCAYEADNNPWPHPATEAGVGAVPNGDVLHHKFGVIDNRIVIMGSENWSESANYSNDETAVIIENSSISDLYTQEYNRIKRNSTMGAPNWLTAQISKSENDCRGQGFHF
jgi:phosphatidylserine/phosphatidylglycerophosphate/cardiolipin synthase-like enzyme